MPDNSEQPTAGASEVKGRKRYNRKRIIIPLLLIVIIAAGVFIYWYFLIRGYVSTNDAYIDSDDVTISSKILGRITELEADEGDTVSEGQLLVQIDDSDLRAQEAQAKANLDYARKNAAVSKVNLQKAKDDLARAQIQFEGDAITGEQYDHSRQAADAAAAYYAASQSQIGTATAQLNVAETQLKNTRIAAPLAGVAAKRWVHEGDVVQPAQPIFTIYSIRNKWVTAYLEETKIASVNLNDQVRISVDSYPGREFRGRIFDIGAAAASQFSLIPPNNASGNFTKVTQRIPIKMTIEQEDPPVPLRAGMSVEIKIKVKKE